MSDADDGPGRREVAHRVFATEYDDASLEYSESDEERAPNYVVTPSGARVNRLFVVGVLTAVEPVNDETVRARVVDPTGAFVVYAGQYQPDELAFFERADPPTFVTITGKANAFSPDDSDRVLTSVRPESVNEVDGDTRDRWVVRTAEQTLARIGAAADALERPERGSDLVEVLRADGFDHATASGIAAALDHYDTSADYLGALRTVALDAVRVVAGQADEVGDLGIDPGEHTGEFDAAVLAERAPRNAAVEAFGDAASGVDDSDEAADATADSDADAAADTDTDAVADTDTDATTETESATATDPEASDSAESDTTASTSTPSSESSTDDTAESTGSTADDIEPPADDTTEPTADTAESGGDEPTATASGDEGTGSSLGNFDSGGDAAGSDSETASDTEGDSSEAMDETAGSADPTDETAGSADSADDTAGSVESPPETDEMYEFDEEEREEIEEEHGLEFSTGTEVESGEGAVESEPDEAEPATDDADAGERESEPDGMTEDSDSDGAEQAAGADEDEDGDVAADADASVDEVLLDQMDALDDGDGAERSALIEAVIDATGASESDVEDAIEDALMGGQCYEPDDDRLKPI